MWNNFIFVLYLKQSKYKRCNHSSFVVLHNHIEVLFKMSPLFNDYLTMIHEAPKKFGAFVFYFPSILKALFFQILMK